MNDDYILLTDNERVAIERERLHALEADHYRTVLEIQLAEAIQPDAINQLTAQRDRLALAMKLLRDGT